MLAGRYVDQEPTVYVEEKLYAGFPKPADEGRMHWLHERGWPERPDIIAAIEDDRFRELGKRVIASERSDLLSDRQRRRWQA